jgi:hypothetical protein
MRFGASKYGSNWFPRKIMDESDFESNRTWPILRIDYVSENRSCEIALDYAFLQLGTSETRSLWALSAVQMNLFR